MHAKVLLLIGVFILTSLAPLNSAPIPQLTEPSVIEQPQTKAAKRKIIQRKEVRTKRGKPVLPAIALGLGITAVVVFLLVGMPGIFIGLAAIVVGSIVLMKQNGYSKGDRLMARLGLLLGSLFSIIGLLIALALFEVFIMEGELFESLYEHVLG